MGMGYVVNSIDANHELHVERIDNAGLEQNKSAVEEKSDEEDAEKILLDENCVSEPELEMQPEVFSQVKDYFTESEVNEGKKRYNKKKFIKMRSSSRVLARNSNID